VFEKTKPDYNVRFWLAEQYCGETIFKVRTKEAPSASRFGSRC
jgi:hypothetical protein